MEKYLTNRQVALMAAAAKSAASVTSTDYTLRVAAQFLEWLDEGEPQDLVSPR